MNDTRLNHALTDSRVATAALDDARTALTDLRELLPYSCRESVRVAIAIADLNVALTSANAAIAGIGLLKEDAQ